MLQIELIPALKDNYIYLLTDREQKIAAVVDPGEAAPVIKALERRRLPLDAVFCTHHHYDHTDGAGELVARYGARLIAPASETERISGITDPVKEGDIVTFGPHQAQVIETPGHTTGHVVFWFEEDKIVFTGDTLFGLGCGRLFEGAPAEMSASLKRLSALPPATSVYCGHEYTQSNARFARAIEPDNEALKRRSDIIDQIRAENMPTLPSTIGLELETNPMLRHDQPELKTAIGMKDASDADVLAELRKRKESF